MKIHNYYCIIIILLTGCGKNSKTIADVQDTEANDCKIIDADIENESAEQDVASEIEEISPGQTEKILREKLSIPENAEKVLIFGMNSHLDPDWMMTFDEYYENKVRKIFNEALNLSETDPAFIYSVSEMIFFSRFYNENPSLQEKIKSLVSKGKIRFVGGGFSSPDMNLPFDEAIIRDYSEGIRFIGDTFSIRPESAWLPDDFGLGSGTPDILGSFGYKYAAFSRIDGTSAGAGSTYAEDEFPGRSTRSVLEKNKKPYFYWTSDTGAKILTLWMNFYYCEGDIIDCALPMGAGICAGGKTDDIAQVFSNIEKFFVQDFEERFSEFRYRFIPTGCDFAMPNPLLTSYIKSYNDQRYPETGIYLVAGSLDDYMKLIEVSDADIPQIKADINPYWTGYFGSRMNIKTIARENITQLMTAEKFASVFSSNPEKYDFDTSIKGIAFSNHHDFITGTSTDQVTNSEQIPLLIKVKENINNIREDLEKDISLSPSVESGKKILIFNPHLSQKNGIFFSENKNISSSFCTESVCCSIMADKEDPVCTAKSLPSFGYRIEDLTGEDSDLSVSFLSKGKILNNPDWVNADTVEIKNSYFDARISKDASWHLTSLKTKDGFDFLSSASLFLAGFADQGGLYRAGCELNGCGFKETGNTLSIPFTGYESGKNSAAITFEGNLDCVKYKIRLIFPAWSEGIVADIFSTVEEDDCSVIGGLNLSYVPQEIIRSVPGGIHTRKRDDYYTPTFWPVNLYIVLPDAKTDHALAIINKTIQGWAVNSDGKVQFFVQRNGFDEKECTALGMGYGPSGSDKGNTIHARLLLVPMKNPDISRVHEMALLFNEPAEIYGIQADSLEKKFIECNDSSIFLHAVIPEKDRYILRFYSPSADNRKVSCSFPQWQIKKACLSTADGKYLKELEKILEFKVSQAFTTISLLI
jgi:hypothetical protein